MNYNISIFVSDKPLDSARTSIWLQSLFGHPAESVWKHIDHIVIEGRFWYINTTNGMTICAEFKGLEPPFPPKKIKKAIELLKEYVIDINELASHDIVAAMDKINNRSLDYKTAVSVKESVVIGYGDLPGTAAYYDHVIQDLERKRRGDWTHDEKPLCPVCIEKNTGFASTNPYLCLRHHWFDPSVYADLLYCKTVPIGAKMNGWQARDTIQSAPEPKSESSKQNPEPDFIVVDFIRPNPNEVPAEQLKDYINSLSKYYNDAAKSMSTPWFYHLNPDTKHWANQCMDKLKSEIIYLTKRYKGYESEEPVSNEPKSEENTVTVKQDASKNECETLLKKLRDVNTDFQKIEDLYDSPNAPTQTWQIESSERWCQALIKEAIKYYSILEKKYPDELKTSGLKLLENPLT